VAVARRQRELWVLVVVSMISDVGITAYGLALGFTEANPIAVNVLRATGLWGLVALKLVVVGLGAVFWTLLPREYSYPIPVALATPWLLATVVNVIVIVYGVHFAS
jgi:hypothetical protein